MLICGVPIIVLRIGNLLNLVSHLLIYLGGRSDGGTREMPHQTRTSNSRENLRLPYSVVVLGELFGDDNAHQRIEGSKKRIDGGRRHGERIDGMDR